jgi:hypothetical protein
LSFCIDASAVGYGGFIQLPSGVRHSVAGTFQPEKAHLSSAAREIIGYVRSIIIALQTFPQNLRNSAVLLHGDSQAALAALKKLASPVPIIHNELKHLFQVCGEFSFDIIPRWIPQDNLTEADKLSRRPDASDWGCTQELVNTILHHFGVQVELDVFASDACHVTERFISAFYVPGCTAVQALAQDWRPLLSSPSATVWAFPPTKAISAALSANRATSDQRHIHHANKNVFQQPDSSTQPPWDELSAVPITTSSQLCQSSLRVPSGAINPILMGLSAFHIWDLQR